MVVNTEAAVASEASLGPDLEVRRAALRRHRRRQSFRDWLSVSLMGLLAVGLTVMASAPEPVSRPGAQSRLCMNFCPVGPSPS